MNGEIIAVGSEILIGDITNTHARFLSKEMANFGISILWHTTVGDNKQRLKEITKTALNRSEFIIFTGGLGPTQDDLTRETVCGELNIELVEDKKTKIRIEKYFEKLGRQITNNNYKQALVPKGCTIFENENGTAPGLLIVKDKKTIILLPGPPNELIPMYNNSVVKYMESVSEYTILSHNINFFGIGESAVDEELSDILGNQNPTLGTYAKDNEVRVRVTAKANNKDECEKLLEPIVNEIKNRIGEHIYSIDTNSLEETVVSIAKEKKIKIATAESCTGGMIAETITKVPGSSECFNGGVISYSNDVKKNILNVSDKSLQQYGAVSEQVAKEMAIGALKECGADIAVATTGIAGPGGGTEEKPVGLVYLGVASKDGVKAIKLSLSKGIKNERSSIRERATLQALYEVFKLIR